MGGVCVRSFWPLEGDAKNKQAERNLVIDSM